MGEGKGGTVQEARGERLGKRQERGHLSDEGDAEVEQGGRKNGKGEGGEVGSRAQAGAGLPRASRDVAPLFSAPPCRLALLGRLPLRT